MNGPEIVWRKSSYSSNGGSCVEVAWRKSSYSTNGSACVEVGWRPEAVLIRDTKNPTGGMLTVPVPAWRTFLAAQRR